MRIISGKLKGRKLADSSKFKDLRPTTDHNREALFNILANAKFMQEHQLKFTDSVFLDLCCGTGGIGIEALSRGVKEVLFIDNNFEHINLLKKNLQLLEINEEAIIINKSAEFIKNNYNKIFDIIFLDPPYNYDYLSIINNLLKQNFFADKTLFIVESEQKYFQKIQNEILQNFQLLNQRDFGKSQFNFLLKKKNA
ncbi:MAG: 16S rRNA (guanine(966)-N(2))-methyltransferase RsmD [Alphaproteobacteria bacterium]